MQLSNISMSGVTIGESLIARARVVRELGEACDTHMLCQSARYHNHVIP